MSDDFVDAPTPDAVPSAPPSAANSDVLPPFTLGTPIAVPGKPGKVDQIKVRKPTAGDILTVGNPVIFDPVSDPPVITHHPVKMSQMIFRLTEISPPTQATMDPTDLVGLWWYVTPFFMPAMGRT